jgi:hypothetical protein
VSSLTASIISAGPSGTSCSLRPVTIGTQVGTWGSSQRDSYLHRLWAKPDGERNPMNRQPTVVPQFHTPVFAITVLALSLALLIGASRTRHSAAFAGAGAIQPIPAPLPFIRQGHTSAMPTGRIASARPLPALVPSSSSQLVSVAPDRDAGRAIRSLQGADLIGFSSLRRPSSCSGEPGVVRSHPSNALQLHLPLCVLATNPASLELIPTSGCHPGSGRRSRGVRYTQRQAERCTP